MGVAKRGRTSMAIRGSRVLTQAKRKWPTCGWVPWRGLGSQSWTEPWCKCSGRCLKNAYIMMVEGLCCPTCIPRQLCLSRLGTSHPTWNLKETPPPSMTEQKGPGFHRATVRRNGASTDFTQPRRLPLFPKVPLGQ